MEDGGSVSCRVALFERITRGDDSAMKNESQFVNKLKTMNHVAEKSKNDKLNVHVAPTLRNASSNQEVKVDANNDNSDCANLNGNVNVNEYSNNTNFNSNGNNFSKYTLNFCNVDEYSNNTNFNADNDNNYSKYTLGFGDDGEGGGGGGGDDDDEGVKGDVLLDIVSVEKDVGCNEGGSLDLIKKKKYKKKYIFMKKEYEAMVRRYKELNEKYLNLLRLTSGSNGGIRKEMNIEDLYVRGDYSSNDEVSRLSTSRNLMGYMNEGGGKMDADEDEMELTKTEVYNSFCDSLNSIEYSEYRGGHQRAEMMDLDRREDESEASLDLSSIMVDNDSVVYDASNRGSQPPWILNFYDCYFIKQLGTGTTSTVYLGKWRQQRVAIKVLRKEGKKQDIMDFKKELAIISKVNSPYIVQFFGATLSPKFCILLEYCPNGTLFHYLHSEKNYMDWMMFFGFMSQTLNGIKTLHTATPQIVHRDLKSLNLLLDSHMQIKICDFGLSRIIDNQRNQCTLFKMRGTYAYYAPEIYRGGKFTSKSDIYSIGIIMYEIIHRTITGKYRRPYAEYPMITNDFQIIHQAFKGLRPTCPPNTPPQLVKLYKSCVNDNPDLRPSAQNLIDHLIAICNHYEKNANSWNSIINCNTAKKPPFVHHSIISVQRQKKSLTSTFAVRNFHDDLSRRGLISLVKHRNNIPNNATANATLSSSTHIEDTSLTTTTTTITDQYQKKNLIPPPSSLSTKN